MAVYIDIGTGKKQNYAIGVDPSGGDPQSRFQLVMADGTFENSNADVMAAQRKVMASPEYQAANPTQNPTANAGTDSFQISAGDRELQQIIAAVLDAWKRGDYGSNANQALQAISRQSGMSVDELIAPGGVWDTVKGSFVAPDGSQNIPTPVESATVVPVPPVVNLSRADLIREQGDQEALRRIRATNFGPLAPLGQRAANSILNQFFGQQPITNFGRDIPREEAFSQFRQSPPTAASLTSALGDIRAAGTSDARWMERYLDESGQPLAGAARDAFDMSIQPLLSNINPLYRARYGRMLGNQFADQAAINPGSYQTPDQIMDLMTTAFTGF